MSRKILISLALMLAGCGHKLTDSDVVVTERLFSPDSNHVAVTYSIDHGAMGETNSVTSILKTSDTLNLPDSSILPCLGLSFYSCYYPDHWIDNKTLQVYLNERPFVKEGIPFDTSSVTVNGIKCKVIPYDYSYENTPLIGYFELSPDRKKLLISYGYERDMNISVINYTDTLPRIGNIFTNTPASFNPIWYVKWNNNEIDMFLGTNEHMKVTDFHTYDYINKNIAYTVNFVDYKSLPQKYVSNGWNRIPLFYDDEINRLLNEKGIRINAPIAAANYRWVDERRTYYYDYEYTVGKHTFRSNFTTPKPFEEGEEFKVGDSIEIVYDPDQPVIHKTVNNYGR